MIPLGFDELIIVPTGEAPHKRISPEPGRDMLQMARLAAARPELEGSDLEAEHDGPSFAFRTLELFATPDPGRVDLRDGGRRGGGTGGREGPRRVLELARLGIAERPGTILARPTRRSSGSGARSGPRS